MFHVKHQILADTSAKYVSIPIKDGTFRSVLFWSFRAPPLTPDVPGATADVSRETFVAHMTQLSCRRWNHSIQIGDANSPEPVCKDPHDKEFS